MSRLWSWLRLCAGSRPTAAPPRPLRHRADSARPRRSRLARIDFELLEDRLAPSATALSQDAWRSERFRVDDVAVTAPVSLDTAQTYSSNQSFGSMIGLDQVFAGTSYRGGGYSVAVIDTGIDYNNPNLGGGWGNRVVAGYDFANNDSDPMDDNGHGTHVAGIIGSSNATYSGIAPNVNLVALKVLGSDGSGSYGAVDDALKWVLANRTKYNIVALNLSLGSGNYTDNPYDFLETEFSALKSAGVFMAVAAGNNFYSYQGTPGLAFPGVSPNVVSVGAVWDGNFGPMAWGSGARDNSTGVDHIASFSQRSSALSIMAPGAMITSTVLHNTFEAMAGTSMASPVIAGAAVLLHQALDSAGKSSVANQDGILALMKTTGVRVVDGDDENDNVANTGLAFQRIDLAAAMRAVGQIATPVNSAPVIPAIANQNVAAGGAVTVALSAIDPNNDPITFSARVIGFAADSGKAYQLKQALGLYALSSYFTNSFGLNEKWLGGTNGYYTLLPSGELRRWTGTAGSTMDPKNLIATLDPTYYNDPTLLLNAQPGVSAPIAVSVAGTQLTVAAAASASGSYQVEVTASDGALAARQSFTVTIAAAAQPNRPPVWTPIADQRVPARQNWLNVPLVAVDPEGKAISYTARVVGVTGITAQVAGNQLNMSWPAGATATFRVEVTASDGQSASVTTFNVAVSNAAPTLNVAATATATAGATSVAIPFVVSDADGDPLSVSAQAASAGGGSLASQLKTTYGLTYAGSYFTNVYGLGEKWLKSADGLQFFCILPNGELHRFTGTPASLTSSSTLLASLDTSFYADPSLLWNAPSAGPKATATIVGNQVVVTLRQPYHGAVAVQVTVSDGIASVKKTVTAYFP